MLGHARQHPSQNAPVRLNAYLARAGVASRRRADELIREGRVRVNGEPGELNTVVGRHDVVEVDGERVEPQPLAYVLLNKPAGVVTTAQRSAGTADRRRPRPARAARRAGRAARRRHDRRAAAHERRRPRAPARASALRRAEGLRGRRRGLAVARRARAASRRRRARRRADGACATCASLGAARARAGSSSRCTRDASTR